MIDEIKKIIGDKVIISVVDYQEKGIYVVHAIPNDHIKESDKWLDGMYSVDKKTLKIIGGFNPLMNDPDVFFNLPKDRVIYER